MAPDGATDLDTQPIDPFRYRVVHEKERDCVFRGRVLGSLYGDGTAECRTSDLTNDHVPMASTPISIHACLGSEYSIHTRTEHT